MEERLYKFTQFISQGPFLIREGENIVIAPDLVYCIRQEEPIITIAYAYDLSKTYEINLEGGCVNHLPKNHKGGHLSLREEAISLQKIFSFIE